ncbi:MAG: hypothetical protein ACRDFX_10515 [Chloroflexota bacterium]
MKRMLSVLGLSIALALMWSGEAEAAAPLRTATAPGYICCPGGGGGPSFPSYTYWKWYNSYSQTWIGSLDGADVYGGVHRNLHVQPLGGGSDFDNYHVYVVQDDAYYIGWEVKDVVGGQVKSDRRYVESTGQGDYQAAQTAGYAMASDVQRDTGISTIASQLMTKHSGDDGDLADCLYGLAVG